MVTDDDVLEIPRDADPVAGAIAACHASDLGATPGASCPPAFSSALIAHLRGYCDGDRCKLIALTVKLLCARTTQLASQLSGADQRTIKRWAADYARAVRRDLEPAHATDADAADEHGNHGSPAR